MNAATTTTVAIDSKDQNRINIFMASAYDIQEGGDVTSSTARARLAYYNMGHEAQNIVCDWHEAEFGKVWR